MAKNDRRLTITILYCIVFYGLMLYKYANGMLLTQINPAFFYSREDIFTWAFMQLGLHQWLLNNTAGCVLMDILFYSAPAIYLLHFRYTNRTAYLTALYMLVVNWAYVQCYTLYPSNCIEGHTPWLLFPCLFMARKEATFNILLDGLRYFFLFFFASAGLWKIRHGSVFYAGQMSGILLGHHIQLLTNSPEYWQSKFILWLVKHQLIAYSLYVGATLMELFYLIGFFTKKYDILLICIFLVFLVMDHFIMWIPYYEVMPFLLTLYPGTRVHTIRWATPIASR
ncbi:hypothetical protein [Parasediminibacterium sp. JCM 36343]|uniref:hypothetical protein n=1 Tax=Parasediminibacterium sp. JCM 36343 TaxID=3374279 RepID=UPI00397D0CE9